MEIETVCDWIERTGAEGVVDAMIAAAPQFSRRRLMDAIVAVVEPSSVSQEP